MIIYKICHNLEWQAAQAPKVFRGTAKDKEDGFLHFSTGAQVPGTLTRFYADATDLMLVAVESDLLGDRLKWEPASDGQTYPHLHGPLDLSAVRWNVPIPRKPNGAFALPPQVFVNPDAPQGRA